MHLNLLRFDPRLREIIAIEGNILLKMNQSGRREIN